MKLYDRIVAALVWIAAFCLACGVFLSITLLFRSLPPTEPVAVGLVTILRYSKARDYFGAALFMLLTPPLTVWLQRILGRAAGKLQSTEERVLFTLPYLFSPLFYLSTGKFGWVVPLPVALSFAGPRILQAVRTRMWLRRLFRPDLRPYHALLFSEATAWLLFRYIVTGRTIAHAPTLLLETVFVALFLGLFWAAALLVARLMQLHFGADAEESFRRITVAALPITALPILAAVWIPLPQPRLITALTVAIVALIAVRIRSVFTPAAAWNLAAWVLLPVLIYIFSYASSAHLSQWVDLFHRGETIGPASDYLRGRIPYRDVFPLHGMLEDGLLDAWLMEIFGRSLDVAVARQAVLASLLGPAIWGLAIVVFRSIPLAILCVALGSWTTAESHRTFLPVVAVALFWVALSRRRRTAALASGLVTALALFFSYETGLYVIGGAILSTGTLAIVSRRVDWSGLSPASTFGWFAAGTVAGAAPFAIWLATHGALDDFFVISLVTIPNIIDSVWSLPFPDLVSPFRNLTLHNLAEFVLFEKFHLVVSPLTIALAAAYYIHRCLTRRVEMSDHALMVLTIFAAIAQRTAFGRASFRHQYFVAFLIAPLLILLLLALVRMLRRVWREGSEGTRAFLAALGVAAIPVVAVLLWIPDLVFARLHEATRYYARMQGAVHEPHAEEVSLRIRDVSGAIAEITRPGEPIFDFSNQPAFYFFADRPNATRFYQVPILSSVRFQEETISDLERKKPKVIIRRSPELFDEFDGVPNDLRAQAVAAYINDAYSFHRVVRGVELWTRRHQVRPRSVERYLALIRLPSEKELVAGRLKKLVFPLVGSTPGLGGSNWQSDLTLHNPFQEPIRLSLRYVPEKGGIDRQVILAPRQTIRWPDVVRTLFGMETSLGTLWVSHREGRAPVAMVKTSDVAHRGARASLQTPLSLDQAASARGGVHGELALVAIPPHIEGRRVNLGVVNTGTIPATFRFSARNPDGSVAGREIESGVPEESVWLVPNAESQMGVLLDESMTVRILAVAGSGVGFASIGEPDGSSQFIAAVPAEHP